MPGPDRRPILVCGSHRSGSSWLGNVLCTHPQLIYVTEPFNVAISRRGLPLNHWFEAVTDQHPRAESVADYLDGFRRFGLRELWGDTMQMAHGGQLKILVKDNYSRARLSWLPGRRPVYKDPIATLSAPWFQSRLDAQVVVCIRHPAAFAASLIAKGWGFDFANLARQQAVMNHPALGEYREAILSAVERPGSMLDQSILIWNVLHRIIQYYRETWEEDQKHWYFIRHEDLSREPQLQYRKIFEFLGLEFHPNTERMLEKSTSSDRSRIHRDSRKNITRWKARLSDDEIQAIKLGTQAVWPHFYTESDW